MLDLKGILSGAAKFAAKKSPEILTGFGIFGFGAAIVMTAKAAPPAKEVHEIAKAERDQVRSMGYSPEKEKALLRDSAAEEAKALAPMCLPVAAVALMSVSCFLFANKVHADRRAALVTAYSLSEKTLSTYQQKVIEKFGEDAHRDILNDTTKEVVRSEAPDGYHPELEVVPMNCVRCYDNVTGRYFFSNKEKIMEAEANVNKRLVDEVRVPLQEFYYELGLEERFTLGDAMGWDISMGTSVSALDVWFTPMLDDDKNPCLALNYHVLIFDRSA